MGRHVSGDDLGLDAAAAQIEGCGDVCDVREQMIRCDAKCACQSFAVQFEVDLSSCNSAAGQKINAHLTALASKPGHQIRNLGQDRLG